MELLAGSMSVQVDEFLHAGYLSAAPRTFTDMAVHNLKHSNTNLIDVKASLQLKTADSPSPEPTQQTAAEIPTRPTPLAPASMASDGLLLTGLFFFFAYLIGLYYRRIRKVERPSWFPWLGALLPVFVAVYVVYWAFPAYEEHRLNSLPPPWAGVPIKEYENPGAATEAILHVLVATALPGTEVNVKQLAAIQHEVAFPVLPDEYTPGMTYAQKTYGRDGWGREFLFQPLTEGQYRVASAGADGSHGTPDDIVLVTRETDFYNWEQLVNGVYVRRPDRLDGETNGEYTCLIHRVSHRNFQRIHLGVARQLTGNELFDMFNFDALWDVSVEPKSVLAQLEEHQQSPEFEAQEDPLFFIQFTRAENG